MAGGVIADGRPLRLNARDPERASRERFDLVIVGGGIYGAMIALEAVRRRMRPLVLERGDFASATSFNSLRIIHGGLRYLQSADLGRYVKSARETAWFLDQFPDMAQPLPVLMPLYGEGLRRRSVFRCALAANDILSRIAIGAATTSQWPLRGRTISAEQTRVLAGAVDPMGLEGGAVWHDAFMPRAPLLVIEVLRWACHGGATALNYVEATKVVRADDRTSTVIAHDRIADRRLEFSADVVVNAAGPWAATLAQAAGVAPGSLPCLSLAWNLVLRRRAPFDHAIAVKPPPKGAQTYFLVPWKGALLAGTGHAPWHGGPDNPTVPQALLESFIDDINHALPGFDLRTAEVAHIFSGLLPAQSPGGHELAKRCVVVDHRRGGEPRLISVSGVKFTEAREVADRVLRLAFPARNAIPYAAFRRPAACTAPDYDFMWMPEASDASWLEPLREIVEREPVERLEDLLLRRSSLGDDPDRAAALAPRLCGLFDWDAGRIAEELAVLRRPSTTPARGAEIDAA